MDNLNTANMLKESPLYAMFFNTVLIGMTVYKCRMENIDLSPDTHEICYEVYKNDKHFALFVATMVDRLIENLSNFTEISGLTTKDLTLKISSKSRLIIAECLVHFKRCIENYATIDSAHKYRPTYKEITEEIKNSLLLRSFLTNTVVNMVEMLGEKEDSPKPVD